jgi:uncharacterized membrane protein
MGNWVLGSVTAVMGVCGLYVSSHTGFGVAYYGGLLFFLFAVLFIFHLIKIGYDEARETTASGELNELFGRATTYLFPPTEKSASTKIVIRSITTADLRIALARGFSDFDTRPTHLFILCAIYPVVGIIFARLTFGYEVLPILFPLVSGFALVAPLAATGLYELSRRREQGLDFSWWHVFDVLHCPSIRSLVLLGAVMSVVFFAWLFAAQSIYHLYFGNWEPASISDFLFQIFRTDSGLKLIVVGCGVGFVFAVVSMSMTVISIPMLLDVNVGVITAFRTSIRVVFANPVTMAIWGCIVVAALLIGSLPIFVGLAVVLPVLGHSTWHLYRRAVEH